MIHYHLPGLFEFYELYARFLPLFRKKREWFYDWCDIGSIYGASSDCLWGGGRVGFGDADAEDVLALLSDYGISARLTFSNSLLKPEHLADRKCNKLCALFMESGQNGVIVHSELLLDYLRKTYPGLYLVSSTTKVLTRFEDLRAELARPEFAYVVPDFRLNKSFDRLETLSAREKEKVEFLCNECCPIACTKRARCYEQVSRMSLGESVDDFECFGARFADRSGNCLEGGDASKSRDGFEGTIADKSADRFEGRTYSFSRAMESPAFISVKDILERYEPLGFTNFKIEGRSLGSALILEFLLYYMTKPEDQLKVREAIYLDSALDLF